MLDQSVIAAARRPEYLVISIPSPARTVFLMFDEISQKPATVASHGAAGKSVFVHSAWNIAILHPLGLWPAGV